MTKTFAPRSILPALAVLMAATALQACADHSKRHFTVGSVSHDPAKRHPIVIGEREQTLDIPVGSATSTLSEASKGAIVGFAQNYARNPNGTISILMPSGSANARNASSVGADVMAALDEGGANTSRVRIMHYDASRHGAAAPIRLSYSAVSASVHECGKWDADLARHADNRNYTNFGCATQKNLAAIVANPADLLAPRGTTPIDGANRANKIDLYQNGRNVASPALPTTPSPTFADG